MTAITQSFSDQGYVYLQPRFGIVRHPATPVAARLQPKAIEFEATRPAISSKAEAYVLMAVTWSSIMIGAGAAWFLGA